MIGDSCGKGYNPWNQTWSIKIPGNKPPVVHNPPNVSAVFKKLITLYLSKKKMEHLSTNKGLFLAIFPNDLCSALHTFTSVVYTVQ